MIKDPVCGKRINRNKAHIVIEYGEEEFYLCCPMCQNVFERDPERYLKGRNKNSTISRAEKDFERGLEKEQGFRIIKHGKVL